MREPTKRKKEVLIAGYTLSTNRVTLTSLILALKDDVGFHYCGDAVSGFQSDEMQLKLTSLLEPLSVERSHLYDWQGSDLEVTWVKPVLVCDVNYIHSDKDGTVRDAEFLWLREDRNINEHLDKMT